MATAYLSSIRPSDGMGAGQLPRPLHATYHPTAIALGIADAWQDITPRALAAVNAFMDATGRRIPLTAYRLLAAMRPWTGDKAELLKAAVARYIRRAYTEET